MQASHRVWVAAHGSGPWPCHRCSEPVTGLGRAASGIIHHEDRDHDNNALSNLRPMHHACHLAEHHALNYRTLASLMRAQIQDGRMPRWMPGHMQLSAEHGVAPGTVLAALGVLKDEGLVIIKPGRGTFVA